MPANASPPDSPKEAVAGYLRDGLAAFTLSVSWDAAKGGKRVCPPRDWPSAATRGHSRLSDNAVAIATGLPDFGELVVIDFDDPASFLAFSAGASAAGIDVDSTRRAVSGSGGTHLYYRLPPGAAPLKSTDNVPIFGLAAGSSKVDVRADGGMIIAPPSAYAMPDGTQRRYRWAKDRDEQRIAVMPLALHRLLPQARAGQARHPPKKPSASSAAPSGPPPDPRELAVPAHECMGLVASLRRSRAAGTRSDWLRVGFALHHNAALLSADGRPDEAALMLEFFDLFSRRCPDKYPGRREIEREWRAMAATPADSPTPASPPTARVTIASLLHMAREDRLAPDGNGNGSVAKEDAEAAVRSLIARKAAWSPDDVRAERAHDGGILVSAPASACVYSTDLVLRTPDRIVPLAADRAIELPRQFSAKALKHFPSAARNKRIRRNTPLEYVRDGPDVARVKPRGDDDSFLIRMLDPFEGNSVVRFDARGDAGDGSSGSGSGSAASTSMQVADVHAWNRDLADALAASNRQALGELLYGQVVNYGTVIVNNGGVINNYNGGDSEGKKAFVSLKDRLLEDAQARRLAKADGFVYQPLEGKPCTYAVVAKSYEKYVSALFRNDRQYTSSADNNAQLARFLAANEDLPEFPQHAPDRDLLSFANGVLELADVRFTPHAEIDEEHPLFGRAARHHIDRPWTGEDDTPALDAVFDHQGFDDDTKRFVLALMGRCLFPVNSHDRWEVMPYIFGVSGAGKSLCLGALQALFDPARVGRFSSKMDGHFGLEAFEDKDAIITAEMEPDVLRSIAESDLKSMVSGEPVVVNRKGRKAITLALTAPIVMASNYLPAFCKDGSGFARRVVPIRFETPVHMPDHDLAARIAAELPSVVARMLRCYKEVREHVAAAGGGLRAHLPEQIRRWGGEVQAETSKLYEFLSLDPEDRLVPIDGVQRRVTIERREGHLTMHKEFAALFDAWTGTKGSFKNDPAVFAQFGFHSPSNIYMCLGCKRRSRSGCCATYSSINRRQRQAIEHLLIREALGC
jgi:hypothetical protein